MSMVTIEEISEIIELRDSNHEWFDLDELEQGELLQRCIDMVLTAYPLKNDLSETNFSEQEEAYQERIKFVLYKLIDLSLKGENEIDMLYQKGIIKYKDSLIELEISKAPYLYRLGTVDIYNLIRPYIKQTQIQMR